MKTHRRVYVLLLLLNISTLNLIQCKKQQLNLSDSYLPVVMQVIAHLTDQMAYEVKDEPNAKPTVKPPRPAKPTASPIKPVTTSKPLNNPYTTVKPVNKPSSGGQTTTPSNWWATLSTTNRIEQTTQFHKPGIYAPIPPNGGDKYIPKEFFVLLPINDNSQYTVLEPNQPTPNTLLEPHKPEKDTLLEPQIPGEVNPLVEPKPDKEQPLLPPDLELLSRTDNGLTIDDEEITDENLQYLSPELKEMIKLAHDPNDERATNDLWDDNRKAVLQQTPNKGKLSSSNLRLLLLYDLLSREAKRIKLNDYSGFSEKTIKELIDSSAGGARSQLSFVLTKMLDRKDCQHDYANNRAREMVTELGKDESLMSNEIRYLQPLVYKV